MAPAPSAELWQSLFHLYIISALVVAGAVFGLFGYLLVRYRRRPGGSEPEDAPKVGYMPNRGSPLIAVVLTLGLTALFFGLTLNTFSLNAYLDRPPADPKALHIQVVGFQWGWRFIYPNGREVDGELRVPVGTTVVLHISSRDVFHSFGIPDLAVKRDALPGRLNQAWFTVQEVGIYPIRCYELCGTGHAGMTAELLAMGQQSFNTWYGGGG